MESFTGFPPQIATKGKSKPKLGSWLDRTDQVITDLEQGDAALICSLIFEEYSFLKWIDKTKKRTRPYSEYQKTRLVHFLYLRLDFYPRFLALLGKARGDRGSFLLIFFTTTSC